MGSSSSARIEVDQRVAAVGPRAVWASDRLGRPEEREGAIERPRPVGLAGAGDVGLLVAVDGERWAALVAWSSGLRGWVLSASLVAAGEGR